MNGMVHSIETMGLVDGPGVRTVVFLAGCQLRCVYCHNPDTWQIAGKTYTPNELVQKLIRYRNYYEKSGGGVTFSGGEPLLQPAFLLEALKLCKENGIHTCIDTSGHGLGDYEEILRYTDLILFDVKHYDSLEYQKITGKRIDKAEVFLQAVQATEVPIWVRHVVIPDITDSPEHLEELRNYVLTIKNVERVELLPYHLLGVEKYKKLGIPYPLAGVPAMDSHRTQQSQEQLFGKISSQRRGTGI